MYIVKGSPILDTYTLSYAQQHGASVKKLGWKDLPSRNDQEHGKQAKHLLELARLAKKRDASSVRQGSLLDDLRRERFLFVYLRAETDQPTFGVDNHVLQVGMARYAVIFIFLDMYKMCRCPGAIVLFRKVVEAAKK
ncbi:hypothetical protein EON63_10245 [archaeon]|nr:MAG: hypothetical protein EON63_10245 [archaeon]